MIEDNIDTKSIPILIILENTPCSLVSQVKYANNGDKKANAVQPVMKILL